MSHHLYYSKLEITLIAIFHFFGYGVDRILPEKLEQVLESKSNLLSFQ